MEAQTGKPGVQVDSAKDLENLKKLLTRSGKSMIVFLAVQYILGMINNFFVTFPDTTELGKLWAFTLTQFTEISHIILGILLLFSAPVFVIRSVNAKQQTWVISSSIGLAGIVIAVFGGIVFVSTQIDMYSLIMSLGFLVAFVGYGWGLYANNK